MIPNAFRLLSAGVVAALIAACGGRGGGGSFGIETAGDEGKVSKSDMTRIALTRVSRTAEDDYVRTLDYVANATANGEDDSGDGITEYRWWNFAYPTLLMSGANTIVATRSL
jgi:hypothetical protein